MKKILILAVFAMAAGFAQAPLECYYANSNPCQTINAFSGANLTSSCYARSVDPNSGIRKNTSVAVSAATNASPVVLTSTGHGFALGSRPNVTIAGGTGNWTAINGTFTATVVDANTFSIPVDSTAFGALAGTITFTTTAPRSTQAEWAVKLFAYDGSGNNIGAFWMNGISSMTQKCSDAAVATTNIQ
ncbi:MAG TPA: hypothetical protein VNL17_14390 [Verrucomicrobiae bacterium]|nr:hypothetical protein [Verrucomicrobiae bacterium]